LESDFFLLEDLGVGEGEDLEEAFLEGVGDGEAFEEDFLEGVGEASAAGAASSSSAFLCFL